MLPYIKVYIHIVTNFERLPPGLFLPLLFQESSPSGHEERPANGVGGKGDGGAAEEDAEACHDQRRVEGGHSGNRPHLI